VTLSSVALSSVIFIVICEPTFKLLIIFLKQFNMVCSLKTLGKD